MESSPNFDFNDLDSPVLIVLAKDYMTTENTYIDPINEIIPLPGSPRSSLSSEDGQSPSISSESSKSSSKHLNPLQIPPISEHPGNPENPNNSTLPSTGILQTNKSEKVLSLVTYKLAIDKDIQDFIQVFKNEKNKLQRKSFCETLCSCCIFYDHKDWKVYNKLSQTTLDYYPKPCLTLNHLLNHDDRNYQFFKTIEEKIDQFGSNIHKERSSGLNIYLMFFYKERFPFHVSCIDYGEEDGILRHWEGAVKKAMRVVSGCKKTRSKDFNGILAVLFRAFVVYFTCLCLKKNVADTLEAIERTYEKIEYNETIETEDL